MTGDELIALAERCEAAQGPNFRLESDIGAAVDFDFREEWGGAIRRVAPAYTASLDAAMTLVPEGCLHMARTIWDAAGKTAGIGRVDRYVSGKWTDGFDSCAASPALALTAAALRALASMKDAA